MSQKRIVFWNVVEKLEMIMFVLVSGIETKEKENKKGWIKKWTKK